MFSFKADRFFILISAILLFTSYLHSQDGSETPASFADGFFSHRKMTMWSEDERLLPQYIPYDYIRDDYKRYKDNSQSNVALQNLEFHLNSVFSYGIHNNTFHIPEFYFMLGKTFFVKDIAAITAFGTINGYLDTHKPEEDYGYIKGNINLYDGGVQAVFMKHILFSARGRATFDVSTDTFMLMPYYVDGKNPTSFDKPHWYVPTVLNGPGIRVGLIGNYYELAYSQGDFRHSVPKAVLLRLNLPYFSFRFLYQHENRKDPTVYDGGRPFESLVQPSLVMTLPFRYITLNLLAEYTWREGDAHYARLEQGIEWNVLSVALREMFYITKNSKKELFALEYTIYAKLQFPSMPYGSAFSIGFQGSTDGRYYFLGKINF